MVSSFERLIVRQSYSTAIATPAGLWYVPTLSTKGKSPDGTNPLGTCALICSNPTNPGASPANRTSAGIPSMVNDTGSTGLGKGAVEGCPVMPAGVVCPWPVAYNVTTEPRGARC